MSNLLEWFRNADRPSAMLDRSLYMSLGRTPVLPSPRICFVECVSVCACVYVYISSPIQTPFPEAPNAVCALTNSAVPPAPDKFEQQNVTMNAKQRIEARVVP